LTLAAILTAVQIFCYQACAVPGIMRIVKRKSSEDLSIWREILILIGASFQMGAMYLTNTNPLIFASPITSMLSVGMMLGVILYYRRKQSQ
jgi:hypothetical protein